MRRLRSRPPRPLVLLLCAVALVGVCWALLVPPWQAPDEAAHFGYAQELSEEAGLPGHGRERTFSTELDLAVGFTDGDRVAANLLVKPEWREGSRDRFRRAVAAAGPRAREDGGGSGRTGAANPARTNPPLYYALVAPAYLAGSGGDAFDRLYLMRLWSVLLLVLTAGAAWLLVGEVLGRRPLLQLVGGAVAGLQPMVCAVSASLNPDALLIAAWSAALWLGARLLRRGLERVAALGLAAAVAVAVLTKATGYALVPAAAFALLGAAWPARRTLGGRALKVPAVAGAVFAVPVAAWVLLARSLDRAAVNQVGGVTEAGGLELGRLASYLWQFYLPKLPPQDPFPVLEPLPVYDVWVKKGWAAFGWLEVRFPEPVYVLLALVSAALIAGALAALLRRRGEGGLRLLAFFALVAAALLAGLHWAEFRVITLQEVGFIQGRYLLPLSAVFGLGAAGLVELLRAGGGRLAAGAMLGSLALLQLASLSIVAGRFYA